MEHDRINSKEDFIRFIGMLLADLRQNPDDWENSTLEKFLEAMIAWTEDSDGYYQNMNLPVPGKVDWSIFADILAGARVYE